MKNVNKILNNLIAKNIEKTIDKHEKACYYIYRETKSKNLNNMQAE